MNYTNVFTDTAERRLHSIACGTESRPMHFLHANGFCAGVYLPFFEHFKNDFSILATDLPGQGDSDHHGRRRIEHWDIFVDDVKDVISRRMTPPVVGMGHSLGAVVTLLTAARYPALFSHLVLIDPVIYVRSKLFLTWLVRQAQMRHLLPLPSGARRRKRYFSGKKDAYQRFSSGRGLFATWPDPFIKAYCNHALSTSRLGTASLKCDPETEAQIFETLLEDIWTYPQTITCPTLLIRGERSDIFSASSERKLCALIPRARAVVIDGASHFVPMEQAGACRTHILKFLEDNS
ncbi:alpha/beta fold hydrolase [Desulfatiferula olefinivorans]